MLDAYIKFHIADHMKRYKDLTIYDYYVKTLTHGSVPSDEFIAESIKNIEANYTNVNRSRIEKALATTRFIYSANHCGFENYSQVLNSSILTQLATNQYQDADNLMYSCATLTPLNPTAPCGLLLGRRDSNKGYKRTALNLASRKYDSYFLTNIPAITKDGIKKRLKTLAPNVIAPHEKLAIEYLSESLETLPKHSLNAQTANFNTNVLNKFLGKYTQNTTYYLEQEKIASALIVNDLKRENSFLGKLFNNKLKLLSLVRHLCNHDNLWARTLLTIGNGDRVGFGTVLFYYIKENGKRYPLSLKVSEKNLYLTHKDFILEITPENIANALAQGRLLPNIYTTYIPMIFLHNVSVIGGIFFTRYIKKMIEITAKEFNLPIPSYIYENYMQAFVLPVKVKTPFVNTINEARPLVLLDIINEQSLSTLQIEAVLATKQSQAFPLSLSEALIEGSMSCDEIKAHESELINLMHQDLPCTLNFEA